ncbi:MAG: hypothetical protein CM15mP109_00460 [Candidatus Dadabacteria bacterium]|nr:MAG: hypothetical protein CM15mP109_00460 [Candidatus Dadabacteria bacterium]
MFTGVIGENIPIRPTNKAISLSLKTEENKWENAAKSIMTTDTFPKAAGKKIIIDNKEIIYSWNSQGFRNDIAKYGNNVSLYLYRCSNR